MPSTRVQRWSWRYLRRLTGLQERLRRRFTPAGQVLLTATFSAGLFGLDTRQTLAHQAFGLGAALLLLAWLGSLRRPPAIEARRQLPRHVTVGEPFRYGLELKNLSGRSAAGLELNELPPDPRPDLDTFLHSQAPGEQKVNPLDRMFAYPRWRWLVQRGAWFVSQSPVPHPDLGSDMHHSMELGLTPLRRGVLRLNGLRFARSDPLGLCRSTRILERPQSLLVLPRRYPIPPQHPPGRRRLQPGGVSLASSVGDSREYMGLRDYQPGDPPSHIHWAAWARRGAPVVKEYQDE